MAFHIREIARSYTYLHNIIQLTCDDATWSKVFIFSVPFKLTTDKHLCISYTNILISLCNDTYVFRTIAAKAWIIDRKSEYANANVANACQLSCKANLIVYYLPPNFIENILKISYSIQCYAGTFADEMMKWFRGIAYNYGVPLTYHLYRIVSLGCLHSWCRKRSK